MKINFKWWIVVALVLVGGGLIAREYFVVDDADGEADVAAASGGGGAFAMPVEIANVIVGQVARKTSAVGTIRSNESIIVRPEITGRVEKIHFTEGQFVEQGTKLVELDGSVFQAELAQARAQVKLSRANYLRAKELFEKKVGTGRARDEALAQMEGDQARLALAAARLAKTVITAPFSGQLGLRQVSIGDFLNPGQDIVNLEQISPIKIDFRVPEVFLGSLAKGQTVDISVDAFPGKKFTGVVFAVDPLVDESGRSVLLRARIPNQDGSLRPGLFARVVLTLQTAAAATQIPEEAVVPRDGKFYVFRVDDGVVKMVEVTLGLRQGSLVEVTEGLKEGDQVVTAGQLKLRDGVPVMAVSTAPSPDSSTDSKPE